MKMKNGPDKIKTVQIFFSFSLRSESSHLVETHLEREREQKKRFIKARAYHKRRNTEKKVLTILEYAFEESKERER